MNRFYHAFSIGWNWWYLVLPATFIIAAVVATSCLTYVKRSSDKVTVVKHSRYLDAVLGVVMAVPVAVLLFTESFQGLVQLLDNHFGYEDYSGISSLLGALFAYTIAVIAIAFMTACILSAVKQRRYIKLKHQLRGQCAFYVRDYDKKWRRFAREVAAEKAEKSMR